MRRLLPVALLLAAAVLPAGARGTAPARARHGMVVTTSEPATRAGVEILKRGGNAVDAAVAVGLALAVTYPAAGNLGGGGFMLVRTAAGEAVAIDFRERAPAAATRDMYLRADGSVDPQRSVEGHLAVAVPGTVAGLALARERFGSRPWSELVDPALRLAERGFPAGAGLAASLAGNRLLARFPESRRVFQRDGRPYEEGETIRQPDLAATLLRLQREGPDEFYRGRTAGLIVEEMKAGGGLIAAADLRSYRPIVREALRGRYRGHEIITMPPPSSGGIALLQMLGVLEHWDLAKMGYGSADRAHLLVEAMRRAFADRSEHPADPDFEPVPIGALLAAPRLQGFRAQIRMDRATPSAEIRPGPLPPAERPETTHYSVIDGAGNAVAVTYTLNGAYGSGVTVRGAGFLLNNEMDDFTAKPGAPNAFGLVQGERNRIVPGKRPLSSMTPTIVTRDGRLYLAIGSPGGPTIINTVLQVIVNVVDHGMNLQEAVDATRIHHQWLPDRIRHEPFGLAPEVRRSLEQRGHRFEERPVTIGDAQCAAVDLHTGDRLGASDRRSPDGLAAGH